MKTRSKKVTVLLSAVCILLNILIAGCGSGSEASGTQEAQTGEALPEEISDMPLKVNDEDMEEPENTAGKWQVFEPEVAAAVDADFMGKIWKIEDDSFFITEKKVKILDDGSLTSSSPSSNADIPDSQLIHVVFDDNTYFCVRTIYENGESHEEKDAGFQDLKEHMSVEMKGKFENDVFYATEIRLLEF